LSKGEFEMDPLKKLKRELVPNFTIVDRDVYLPKKIHDASIGCFSSHSAALEACKLFRDSEWRPLSGKFSFSSTDKEELAFMCTRIYKFFPELGEMVAAQNT
jgi:hypothetical protein